MTSTEPPVDTESPASPLLSDRKLLRSSAGVALGTALSRLTGLVRVSAVAYALGGAVLADTYNVANNTPNIVFELILGGVLTATLVPLFVDAYERHDDDAASAIFGTAMTVVIALTAIAIVGAPFIAHLFTFRSAHGADRIAAEHIATDLIRLFIPQMVFYALTALLTAMLNARRRFLAAAYAPALNNVVAITLFLLLPHLVTDGGITLDHVASSGPLVLILGIGTTAGIVRDGARAVPRRAVGGDTPALHRVVASPRGARGRAVVRLDRRLRDRQPDRAHLRARHCDERERCRVRVHVRVRVLPTPPRTVRGQHHDHPRSGARVACPSR